MEVLLILQENWPLATSVSLAVYFFLRAAYLKAKCRGRDELIARLRYERPLPAEVLIAKQYKKGVVRMFGNMGDSEDFAETIRAFNEGLAIVLKK